MNTGLGLRRPIPGWAVWPLATGLTAVAAAALCVAVDRRLLIDALGVVKREPDGLVVALAAFGLAFLLRALSWKLIVRGISFGQSLAAIHLALGANHVLPFRLGEPLRVVSATRRAGVPADVAAASTMTLRSIDMLTVVAVGVMVSPSVFTGLVGPLIWALVGGLVVVAALSWLWLHHLAARELEDHKAVQPARQANVLLAASAWAAESVVVWYGAQWAGIDLAWNQAILVTTVAVAAQVAALAPGGLGTYEAAAVAAYVALGHDADEALVAALAAHGLKTIYSLLAGLVALVAPTPGFFGYLRLNDRTGLEPSETNCDEAETQGVAGGNRTEAPILFFLPAHNEEASVADVVRRIPRQVLGHAIEVLVIDDGSDDHTALEARAAGADVHSLAKNCGLGSAVRLGLNEGTKRRVAAVVFCDADGEYRPEEVESLLAPILAGEADYVTGSRFLGQIDYMHPHRRFGNRVLSLLLSVIVRRRISDGQSGYRALSRTAAGSATIIHDFNYAQVLTLDLLAKGFRLLEVPISYRFRVEGQSFVKLVPYLRQVIPAVHRQLNTTPAMPHRRIHEGAPSR